VIFKITVDNILSRQLCGSLLDAVSVAKMSYPVALTLSRLCVL